MWRVETCDADNLLGEMLRQAMLMCWHWALEIYTADFYPIDDLSRHTIDFMTIRTCWYQGFWHLRFGLADMRDGETHYADAWTLYAEVLVARSIADLALKLACELLSPCASHSNICYITATHLLVTNIHGWFHHKCFSFKLLLHFCFAPGCDE